jgi:ferredoxin/flavodoxin
MKVTILVFSPSGNTANIAALLQQRLEEGDAIVQLVNVTGNPNLFNAQQHTQFLRDEVAEHDVLCVGAPVYTHHLQYHMHDLLKALPEPGNGWGNYAFLFVTYGGINSGIALEEAGDLLTQSGRTVLGGMKVAAAHHSIIRAFVEHPINLDLPEDNITRVLDVATEKILAVKEENSCRNQAECLKYQPREVAHKANTVFIEKEWHATRYPKVMFDSNACTQCGKCVAVCPVHHLANDSAGTITQKETSPCIHCLNCVASCPAKAISLRGDLERSRAFITNMLKNGTETPGSAIYPE